MAGVTGLEPATSAVTGQRSKPIELHPRVGENRKKTLLARQPKLEILRAKAGGR